MGSVWGPAQAHGLDGEQIQSPEDGSSSAKCHQLPLAGVRRVLGSRAWPHRQQRCWVPALCSSIPLHSLAASGVVRGPAGLCTHLPTLPTLMGSQARDWALLIVES